ncbi:alpha/beta fold hydrolase [Nonomuraea harbinensis]|uniref:Alpha/beta fold hydrolase n=1 Tax=Nonomuraea harbinensis TaxID=1286938 RepID=A0ABW1BYD3_9ACTN|nr:alpha/beta fold hydrolase [Nonomuraea harbinensis]
MRRSVLILSLVIAAVLPLVPVLPAGASGGIAWTPCPEAPEVECGTLAVPVDWDDPGGPTLDLALARRKATGPGARIGSLVINPGGPGGSGVDAVITNRIAFTAKLTSRFDVVSYDPRGVRRSHPVRCSLELALRAPDPLTVGNRAGFEALLAHNERYRQDCRARTGPLFDHVDTGSVVRDLDALRAALGDRKLTAYGLSYGTLITQLYAERYPHRVRALALDSTMDHSLRTRAFLDTESRAAQDSFDEFVSWCGRTESCALHGRDVRAVWAELLERAGRGELTFPGEPGVPLSRTTLIRQAFGAFYGPDYSGLARFLVALETGGPAERLLAAATPQEETVSDASRVFCLDYLLPVRDHREYAAHLRRSAEIAPDMLVSPLAYGMLAACAGTRAPIPNPQHRLRVDGTPPLLLANALHDPATAYAWATAAARQIGREARLLTYEGWGHGVYGMGDCATAVFDRYLVDLEIPAEGARCPAVPPSEGTATLRDAPPDTPFPGTPGYLLSRWRA